MVLEQLRAGGVLGVVLIAYAGELKVAGPALLLTNSIQRQARLYHLRARGVMEAVWIACAGERMVLFFPLDRLCTSGVLEKVRIACAGRKSCSWLHCLPP